MWKCLIYCAWNYVTVFNSKNQFLKIIYVLVINVGVSIYYWCWPYHGVWPFMLRQSLVWVQTTEFKYKSVGSTLTCNDVNDDSCRVIRNGVPLFRHQRSNNIRTDNLHKNVKLECVREKYWHREEQKCNLGRSEKKESKSKACTRKYLDRYFLELQSKFFLPDSRFIMTWCYVNWILFLLI